MRIIDFNKKNKNLICEIGEEEYKRIIVALNIVYPPYLVAPTRFRNDEIEERLKVLKNGMLPVYDEPKPKVSKDTLNKLNDTTLKLQKFLSKLETLPANEVFITLDKYGLIRDITEILETLNQIKKEVDK